MTTKPTVTVVVPCYNYGRYLPDAVRAVLAQPGVEVDVIIVDDASTDGSRDIAAELAAGDDRIHLLQHEANKGHIATYNDGLSRASGKYVVLLSADDMLSEGSLARSVALLEAHPEVSLVYGYAPTFSDVPPPAHTAVRNWTLFDGEEWIGRICERGTNIIVNPEAVMRTSVLHDLGGYDSTFPQAADMLLWMQAATRGTVGRVNGPDQAFYRVHGNNMHMTDFGGHLLTEMTERRSVFERFFAADGAALAAPVALEARARRAIGVEALRCASIELDAGTELTDETASDLADFALDCDDTLRSSRQWASYIRRTRRRSSRARTTATAFAFRVRWSLRWRRWRRYGI
ncbi:MAG: glycosyltransferase [Rhodococcus sp. (in: high G+C Gram-positive bacteria)]